MDTSNGLLDSPSGFSLFKDADYRTPPREHKVLLSYESVDKIIRVLSIWSYHQFMDRVAFLFPDLKKNFTLIDADFQELDEDGFSQLKRSNARETWLLVRENDEKEEKKDLDASFILGKPRYELLKYDVHPNALTQSGNYHFSSCYQAFCEFIDNAIQATINNSSMEGRKIDVHVYLKQKITCIFDNGGGMTSEGMKAFASYFLSQTDRGFDDSSGSTFGFMDGNISKFGVGATQAGFYLGETIKVITKKCDSPFVTEIAISKEKLHERAKLNMPVFEDYKCIRNPGDCSTLMKEEQQCLSELVRTEARYQHFTMIVIKGIHQKHIDYMDEDNCSDLAKNFAHVYHYYLHGIGGRLNKLEFDRLTMNGMHQSKKQNVSINLIVDKGSTTPTEIVINEIQNDLQSLYQVKTKSVFSFCLELKLPEINTPQVVQGCLMYFPSEFGEETLPTANNEYVDSNTPEPMFECFWQGRLAPLSYVNRLDFCLKPENRTRKQKDLLPDICFKRLRGLLFFNRYTPVSNNKLKILLDTRRDLSDALSDASAARRLPLDFRQWLEQCHREFDREIMYEHPLPAVQQPDDGNIFYAQVKMITSFGEEIYTSGDTVKIDSRPVLYGLAKYFIKKAKVNEVGSVIFTRLPEEVYGDVFHEKPIMRLAGKPDNTILNKVFSTERMLLPKTMKIFYGENKAIEVPSKMEFQAGEEMKKHTDFWVAVYDGERPPRMVCDIHQRKISVKVEVTGRNPLTNNNSIDNKYGFKSFYIDKVGLYDVTFTALLGKIPCNVSKKIHMKIVPNVAEIVNLLENSPENVELGAKVISFTLSFHDVFENNTNLFKGNNSTVTLTCSSEYLVIKGVKASYKPNKDGKLIVSGVSVEPKPGLQLNFSKDYEFWVVAEGIGDVMFPFRLLSGVPDKIKTTQLESYEFENYDNFPEFEVKVLDKWDQPSVIQDEAHRLALTCDALSHQILFSTISNGKAKFSSCSVKVERLNNTITSKVKILLVVPETHKKKPTIKEVIRDFLTFDIKILPCNICQRIAIVNTNADTVTEGDFFALEATAGSVVSNLKVIGFGPSGKRLTDSEFIAHNPHITTTWAEVNPKALPLLPDCPVTNIIQVNVQNVQCFCQYNGFEIRNETKLRISVVAGEATKWCFQPLSLQVCCEKKKDLYQVARVVALDKHHNETTPRTGITPVVTVEHAKSGKTVVYSGDLVLKNKEFRFTPLSALDGHVGPVTLNVNDEKNLLSRDSITIQLESGQPSKLSLTCASFEETNGDDKEYIFYMYSNASLSSHLICSITDNYGNFAPVKTPIALEWQPKNAGSSLTKRTTAKGEVIFQSHQLKCLAKAGNAKIKISATELSEVKSSWITVKVLQCNKVTGVDLSLNCTTLNAGDRLPIVKISHTTEDGVAAQDFKNNLNLFVTNPSGRNVVDYPKSLFSIEDGFLICKPVEGVMDMIHECYDVIDANLQRAGTWSFYCQYTEKRSEIKEIVGNAKVKSDVRNLEVSGGPAAKLALNIDKHTVLFASSTADLNGRTLLPIYAKGKGATTHASLYALDEFDNTVNYDGTVNLTIEKCDRTQLKDVVLPQLEKTCSVIKMKGLETHLSRICLKERVGNKIGYYNVVFSSPPLEPCGVKFSFSTNEEFEKVSQELVPYQTELTALRVRFREKQDVHITRKNDVRRIMQMVRNFFTIPEPTLQDIDIQIAKVRNENYEFELRQHHLRKVGKDPNYPPHNIRQYIKGLVCELAYVSDENLCRILSWYAQGKMKVSLCETKEQQKRVYDLGCPAYSENLINGFSKRGFSARTMDLLPIDLPKPPDGFRSQIDFAVNLLEFKEENRHLRASLFFSVFSRTIVVSDLEQAQRYREHVVKLKQSCPAILTLGGDLIASDGLMDPSRKCPPRLNQLRYTFGELPPEQRKQYQKQQSNLQLLEELRRSTFDANIAEQDVKQNQLDLKQKEMNMMPKIRELEKKLDTLRKAADVLQKEYSPPKKKRR